jgi:hypothetical protein
MSYNSSATIYVTNNTGGNAVVSFSHEYSDDGAQVFNNGATTPNGQNAGPLSVGFNTGAFHTGQDYWFCGVTVSDGPNAGSYASEGSLDDPTKQCTLESEDNGKTLYFSVTTTTFTMTEVSGSCSTGMSAGNAAAALAAKPVKKLSAKLVKKA